MEYLNVNFISVYVIEFSLNLYSWVKTKGEGYMYISYI